VDNQERRSQILASLFGHYSRIPNPLATILMRVSQTYMTISTLTPLSVNQSIFRCVLSGILFSLCFPHADLGWLIWASFIPFLSVFPAKSYGHSALYGLIFGLVAYTGLLYWIGVFASHIIGPALACVGLLLAAVSQAIVVVAFGVVAQWLSTRKSIWPFFIGAPALWTILEWVRQLGPLGTGWGDIAYTQHNYILMLMQTRLAGVWGLAWLIVAVNTGVLYWLRGQRNLKLHCVWFIPLVLTVGYGISVVRPDSLDPGHTIYAAALQPNISENVPWSGDRPADPRYVQNVMDTLHRQMAEAEAKGSVLCVAPETYFPGYPEMDPGLRTQLNASVKSTQQTLVIGGNAFDSSANADTNSLFSIWPDGQTHGIYSKQQLVPFGEFVPFRRELPILEALHVTLIDRAAGDASQPLVDAGPYAGKLACAICYESSYGRITRGQIDRGANLIVIITDDTWFGHTAAARQHAAIAAVRAAESDRYVVRSAETGISQVIDPYGRVLSEAGLFVPAVVVAQVEPETTITPYVRYGDWFIAACFALLIAGVLSGRGQKQKIDDNPDH